MTAQVLQTAKERGFKVVMSESTSAYTQHNKINRFGFEVVAEMSFDEYYATYSEAGDDFRNVHKSATALVKTL